MAIREGTQLNDAYEIDRLIGSGGMGEIFRGHEIQTGDAVAIKLIRLDMEDNEAALSLFQKEASVLKHIYHEAVVRYYVFSLDRTVGRHFLAMEFVNGPSLSTLIQDGPLPPGEIDALRKRVAGGLQVAHERGVIHRDVTPDNIILPDGDGGQAKIIDFGIARSTGVGGGTIIGGGFAGKYNYVSPEQLGLFGGDVTAKSDIYSFGLVLAAAAGGRPLVMDGSHADTIEKRRKVPDLDHIDARLRPLLASMLQPDPNDRAASMAEVAAWSSHAMVTTPVAPVPGDHRGVRDRPAPKAGKAKSRSKKTAERWIFGGAALVALLGIVGVVLFQSMGSQPTLRPNDPGGVLVPGTASSQPDTPSTKQAATPIGEGAPSGLGATVPKVPPQTGQPVSPPPGAGSTVASLETNETQIGRFLRTFDGGPCFFAHSTSSTATSANIEAFAASNAAFETFDQAMTKAVGFEPDITGNRVWSHQCPAVDFLRATQRAGARPKVAIFLKSTRVKSGQSLAGEVSGTGGQSVSLFDIREDGMVENLSRLLKEKPGGRDFDIPLVNSDEGKGPYPRLILIVAAPNAPNLPTGSVPADEFFKALAGNAADLDVSAKMVLLAR